MSQEEVKEYVTRDIRLKGRKVQVSIKVAQDGKGVFVESDAVFHVWGFRKMKTQDRNAAVMETTAIVELPDGKIRMVQPERVKFLDQGF